MKSCDFIRRYLFTAHQRCTEAPSHADHHTKLVFNPLVDIQPVELVM